MEKKIIYNPDKAENALEDFRCMVPLEEVDQVFVVDGQGDFKGMDLQPGEILPKMLQVISVRQAVEELACTSRYHLGEGAEARVLLCSHTHTDCPINTHETVEIKLEKGASLDIMVMQNEHNASRHDTSFKVELSEKSTLTMHILTLHGGEIANNVDIALNGRGGICNVNGLYLADGKQRISTTVNLCHNVPDCYSNQLFKGILDDESVTRFNGKVYVAKDAQKTEAYQANNNLLASRKARAYTRPHLEIYADDVICTHGATVGSLNGDELFYMRSRGIDLEEAKLLQQQAFAYAVLEKISHVQLRDRLHAMVESRLRGEFSQCAGCSKQCC